MTAQQLRIKSHLIERGSKWHIALSWYDESGNRSRTTVSTGIIVGDYKRGHKTEYDALLETKRKQTEAEYESKLLSEAEIRERPAAVADRILFSDWMLTWLRHMIDDGNNGEPLSGTTLYNYNNVIKNSINPYFKERNLSLSSINKETLKEFYKYKQNVDGVSENTVKHYHANIRKALSYAVDQNLLSGNAAVDFKFSKKKPVHNYYNEAQLNTLVNHVRGTELEAPIFLASSFGLRRGEILGIRWSVIDFTNGILFIKGELLEYDASGHNLRYEQRTKTEKSERSFWLTEDQISYLKGLKADQDKRREAKDYNHKWDDFVCVKSNGDIISPWYLSTHVPKITVACGLPRLKLHELRHTVISLLILKGHELKEVSEFAGHSNISTTADIYGHLPSANSKRLTATMGNVFTFSSPLNGSNLEAEATIGK